MNLLLYMAPIAVLLLLPVTLYMERNVIGITLALAREDIRIIWYLLFNSVLAYFVNLTNFLVTKHTSALTLQVYQEHDIFVFTFSSKYLCLMNLYNSMSCPFFCFLYVAVKCNFFVSGSW